PPRSSRLAWRQGPQGSKQHLALAAAATRTRTQRPRKYLAIHAAELAVEPNFQILRRHRRSLLLRLEHAHRSAVENHVHRAPRLGSRRSFNLRIGISLPPSKCLPVCPPKQTTQVNEYTPFCNGPGDVKSPRVIVTPPSSRFCPWLALRPPHYAVRRNGEPI